MSIARSISTISAKPDRFDGTAVNPGSNRQIKCCWPMLEHPDQTIAETARSKLSPRPPGAPSSVFGRCRLCSTDTMRALPRLPWVIDLTILFLKADWEASTELGRGGRLEPSYG